MRDLQETHAKIAAVMDERDAISRTFGVKSRPRSATTHHGYGPDWHPVKGEIPPRLTSLEAKLEKEAQASSAPDARPGVLHGHIQAFNPWHVQAPAAAVQASASRRALRQD